MNTPTVGGRSKEQWLTWRDVALGPQENLKAISELIEAAFKAIEREKWFHAD